MAESVTQKQPKKLPNKGSLKYLLDILFSKQRRVCQELGKQFTLGKIQILADLFKKILGWLEAEHTSQLLAGFYFTGCW